MAPLDEFKPAFFTVESHGDATLLRLAKPSLSEEENIEQLSQELSTIVDHYGCRRIVVDFADVKLITSAALGKFIALHRNLHRKEGRLSVSGVAGMVKDVFKTTKLIDYFKVADSIEEAIRIVTA